ncbi:GL23463 [Drosophila persimilis]|uniref:GL23463 n=1 Tax=Drosophila persimilis TaxID=7234 RepID=B4G3E9_DROPE|nr:GL23463 [Drosophila persimilis]
MLFQPLVMQLSPLLRIIIGQYFASFSSILIVHNNTRTTTLLQLEYLRSLELVLKGFGQSILLQWINVGQLSDLAELEWQVMSAVNSSTIEGFITILPQTNLFLHARYYATRNANVRLKDKRYLFLCEDEHPQELLAMDILQFYPHHLMVRPGTRAVTGPERGPATVPVPAHRHKEGTSVNTESTRDGSRLRDVDVDGDVRDGDGGAGATLPYRDINFELWTQKFVGAFGNLDAVRLGAFLPNETFAGNSRVELYPNKLLDLQQRTLRLGSITYVPYTITNYVPAGEGNEDPIHPHGANRSIAYYGAEANVMKTFCQVHHCHLRVEAYGADNWGSIYENESSDGMLGDIYEQRVELAIGCIYNWYDGITETSYHIARSSVTILGPAPAPLPSWRTNILPFNGATWLLLISTMVICGVFLYVMKFASFRLGYGRYEPEFHHAKKIEQSLLDTFALFIQQPSAPLSFDRFATRFFLATLLCATITLENIYSGQLKSLLTVPFYSAPVDTIEKWAQAGWKWAAPSIVWVHTVESSDLGIEQILARNFEVRDHSFLSNASFSPNYGLGIERLVSGSLSVGNYVPAEALENRIVLHDDLYFDWTRAVSIRGWTLMPELDRHILTCQETGLYVHWELEFVVKYMDKKVQEILLDMVNGPKAKGAPKPLNVSNISGALFVLAFGYTFAFSALLVETAICGLQKIK